MIWVWIFLGIAVLGLAVLGSYTVWLIHKASDLMSELTMLGTRAEELAQLVSSVKLDPAR